MVSSDDVRASGAEREAVVSRLGSAVGEGRLTLEEFGDRVSAVYAARTKGELVPYTEDLPDTPAPARPERSQHHQTVVGTVKVYRV